MNTIDIENGAVAIDEYFAILKKKEPLTPKETIQKRSFEAFLDKCENSERVSDLCHDICTEYRKELAKIYCKENLTDLEKEAIARYESKMENTRNEEAGITRSLSKSGYVDATVILVLLLNIGFIIAMALLGSK